MLHFRGGRAGISKEAYPELDPVFYDDVAKAYGDELRSLADAGCTLRADGRHQPGLPVRREDARGGAPARRRPQRAAAPLRQVHQQGGGAEARRHDAGHAPVPRQLQEHARRAPATTSRWPRRCWRRWTSTPTSWSTTTTARATSGRCATCPRARPSCSGLVTTKFGQLEKQGRPEAPHRRGARSTRRWSSWRCRRSAASPAPCTATTSPWKTSGASSTGGGDRARSLELKS